MARGPLPKPGSRRRNAPTIPTTSLPVAGRKGAAPKSPYVLGKSGRAWWKWAWATPQAAAWDTGSLYALARRAQMEDELAALGAFEDTTALRDLLAGAEPEAVRNVEFALGTLKRQATGSTTLMREMRELDSRFGLTPKAMADLRWSIVAAEEQDKKAPATPAAGRPKLRAV